MKRKDWSEERIERFKELFYEENLTYEEIAEKWGMTKGQVRHQKRKLGLPNKSMSKVMKKNWQDEEYRNNLSGKNHYRFKDGRYKTSAGYIERKLKFLPKEDKKIAQEMSGDDGVILEHRLVKAKELGRPLKSAEYVHHLNGIKDDNRPENLAIVDAENHEHNTLVNRLRERIRELEQMIYCKEAGEWSHSYP